jgi:hypothetical protein
MFCGGNTLLPNGDLLFAGGTARYENLTPTNAAGVMTVIDRSPGRTVLPKGTIFTSPDGIRFRTIAATSIRAATVRRVRRGKRRTRIVMPSQTPVWVQAVASGNGSVINAPEDYTVTDTAGVVSSAMSGRAPSLTRAAQNYWGTRRAYIFDPVKERYERVSSMRVARWYPTLVPLPHGNVLAVSGLDQFGRMIEGTSEEYRARTKTWAVDPHANRVFPTYPALFVLPNGHDLFYAASNAGYGSAKVGRTSGIWDIGNDSFQAVPGMRAPHDTETSAGVLLPPAQDQRYAIIGGGGVGQSNAGTGRIDVVDLKRKHPRWHAAANLPVQTRYPNAVVTPDDTVIISNGSKDYRGMHGTDLHQAFSFDPANDSLTKLAAPEIGRDYHSEALLLPDGRIITIGGNPLFGNKEDTEPQTFEQRLEVFSPPYLYRGARPKLTGGPSQVTRGTSPVFTTPDPAAIKTARLIYPGVSTHVTDVTQRSVALMINRRQGAVALTIPRRAGLVPAGWWMLFVTNAKGVPSIARWVHVG